MNRERLAGLLLRPGSRLIEPAVIVQEGPGDYNDRGEFVPGPITRLDIVVVTAPLSGEERLLLPEGLRSEETRTFWTRENVQAQRPAADGDIIEYAMQRFRRSLLKHGAQTFIKW